jgi:hypothetical protein
VELEGCLVETQELPLAEPIPIGRDLRLATTFAGRREYLAALLEPEEG